MTKRRGGVIGLGTAAAIAASLVFPSSAWALPPDVPADHWAAEEISYVSEQMGWMVFPEGTFQPEAPLRRRDLARAVVAAFAPADAPDPERTFGDVPPDDPNAGYYNVAVTRGFMKAKRGLFRPDAGVTKRVMDTALVRALGLDEEVRGLNAIATADGLRFKRPKAFAPMVLADQLKLHRNYPNDEPRELLPRTVVSRADTAFALARAARMQAWQLASLGRYRSITLPAMDEGTRSVVEFSLRYAGYPYVWGGEWHKPNPSQATGGFDCSGWAWWVLRAHGSGWDNSRWRPYQGWALPERTSRYMAQATTDRIAFDAVQPLDVLFFNTSGGGKGWESVDHVGIALGDGWMIHSSGSRGGVTIDWIGDGWWAGRFVWARRVAA